MWKKIWNSPTVTGWLYFSVVPLRLFLLTPLVLSRLSKHELDAFFLFASTMVLASVVDFRMGDTFDKMLCYAVAGGKELSPLSGLQITSASESNWELFQKCRQTQRTMTLLLTIPLGIVCALLGWLSVGRLLEWDYTATDIWIGMILNIAGSLISINLSPLMSNLKAFDKSALSNRLGLLSASATIILSAIAVVLGARLAVIGLVQLVVVIGYWQILKHNQPVQIKKSKLSSWSMDVNVLSWAWRPLIRGFLIQIATFGTARSAGMFLAGNHVPGQLAQFMFAQNLLVTLGNFSSSAVMTQIPRYARELVSGQNLNVVKDGTMRIGMSMSIMLFGILGAAITAPTLLRLIHSNVDFIDFNTWIIFGLGFTLYSGQNLISMVHDSTNQQIMYIRSICSSLIVISLLCAFQYFEVALPLWVYCIAITTPYLLVINWFPIKKLAELGGVSICTCSKWILFGGYQYARKSAVQHKARYN